MSRQQQPFPPSQRRPSVSDNPSGIRPLQISRNPRPTTPSNVSVSNVGGSPGAPTRPERSSHRHRPSEHSIPDVQSAYRPPRENRERKDSASTTRSNESLPYPAPRNGSSSTMTPPPRARRPNRQGTLGSEDSDGLAVTAISAFTTTRKKTLEDEEWERDRKREAEEEERRQLRIKERVPGRRANGRARAGDIDGVLRVLCTFTSGLMCHSDPRRSQGRVGICHQSRRKRTRCAHEDLTI
jgi:exocyst complex component 4